MLEPLFRISFCLLALTYFGYPAALALLALLGRSRAAPSGPFEPPVITLVIPVRNEARHIRPKIRNCGELDYPAEKTEILVIDDGSSDRTPELARAAFDDLLLSGGEKKGKYRGLRVIELKDGPGKPAALNRGCREASGEILIFSDADCRIARDAPRLLVRHFADPAVGCVAGRYAPGGLRGRNSGGAGFYWRYEDFLRRKESEIGGVLGASGALYALRRELYTPLDSALVNDDFVVPMRLSLKGRRTLYEPLAVAVEDESRNEEVEFPRRVRIMAGNCQHLLLFCRLWFRSRGPFRPLIQMFCHKFLRVLSPFCLIGLFASNAALAAFSPAAGFYAATLAAQVLFYGLAGFGFFLEGAHRWSRIATLPYYFTMVNVAALFGVFHFLRGRGTPPWGRNKGG